MMIGGRVTVDDEGKCAKSLKNLHMSCRVRFLSIFHLRILT